MFFSTSSAFFTFFTFFFLDGFPGTPLDSSSCPTASRSVQRCFPEFSLLFSLHGHGLYLPGVSQGRVLSGGAEGCGRVACAALGLLVVS